MGISLKSPTTGAAIGGGASAITQIALRLTIKLDDSKSAADQKTKLFLYRHAGLVGLGVSALAAAGLWWGAKAKDSAIAALIGGTAASLPGIVSGIKAMQLQKQLGDGYKPSFGVAVAESRGFSGSPNVTVFGNLAPRVETFGTSNSSGGGNGSPFSSAAFGGGSF